MTFYVYALTEPDTGEIRYVGKSDNPAKRLVSHAAASASKSMREWIRSLGRNPELVTLAQFESEPEAIVAEAATIRKLRTQGARLLNNKRSGALATHTRRQHFTGFGERASRLRISMLLTMSEMEDLAGMCPGTLHRIESGERFVRADTAVLLARALGVSVEWLVTGEERAAKTEAA